MPRITKSVPDVFWLNVFPRHRSGKPIVGKTPHATREKAEETSNMLASVGSPIKTGYRIKVTMKENQQ
jgi:hypothetical protein